MASESRKSRIVDIPPEDMTPAQQAALAAVQEGRGRVPTPYRIWLHSPELIGCMEKLGTFLANRSSLSGPEAELAIIMIARHWNGKYVLEAHARRALNLGLPKQIVEALRSGLATVPEDVRLRAVYEITDGFIKGTPHPDEVFDAAVSVLGHGGIAELIALLGYFSSVSMAMKIYGVPVTRGTTAANGQSS